MESYRILIIGAGGLGCPAAWAIAGAADHRLKPVPHLTLVDPDPVELSNLARQTIYRMDDLGRPKVEAAAGRLAARFLGLEIETLAAAFNADNCVRLAAAHDFMIDGTDDPAAKFLINDAAIAAGRPFVYGGVLGMTGQALTVIPGATACLRCLFENPPADADALSCREAGVLGPIVGAIGTVQAAEAIRAARGQRPALAGKILTYDAGESPRVRVTTIAARPGCNCGAAAQKGEYATSA